MRESFFGIFCTFLQHSHIRNRRILPRHDAAFASATDREPSASDLRMVSWIDKNVQLILNAMSRYVINLLLLVLNVILIDFGILRDCCGCFTFVS